MPRASRNRKRMNDAPAPSPALPEEDDGRMIASMNVEGMPWYTGEEPAPKNPDAEPLTGRNLWRYAFSAVGAGLLIVSAFGAVGAAFIWFCVHIWFR